jgi:hypothetical protein
VKIHLFGSYTRLENTPEQNRLLDGVIECGGSISHVSDGGPKWFMNGSGYQAFGVFDRDEDAIAFKLKYL